MSEPSGCDAKSRRRSHSSEFEAEYRRRRSGKRSSRENSVVKKSHSHRSSRRGSDDEIVPRRKEKRDRRDGDSRHDRDKDNSRRERDYRERSASRERSHDRRRSRSPPAKRRRRSPSQSPVPDRRSRAPLPSQNDSFRGTGAVAISDAPSVEKQKPNYKPTGLLAKEANTVAGTTTVLKYHEPPEARKPPPKEQWRMYVFKKKDMLDTIYIHQRSAWLIGRDQNVTDLLLEHPSISKQHAVIQFRYITSTNEFGDKASKVRPYLIDLESANGTKLNGKKLEASRFVELVDGDVVMFGDSEREYVLMLPPSGT